MYDISDITAAGKSYTHKGGHGGADYVVFGWWLTDLCQYRCSYCYAADFLGTKFVKNPNLRNAYKTVLKRLGLHSMPPFNMELLGGEPTLHPDLPVIVKTLSQTKSCNEVNIITNFVKPVQYYTQFDYPGKYKEECVTIVPTYHPEYHNTDWITKLIKLNNTVNYVEISVNVNLTSNDPKTWPNCLSVIKILKDNNITIDLNPLQSTAQYTPKYTDEFWDTFLPHIQDDGLVTDRIPHTVRGEETTLNEADIFRYGINRFKGWKCTPLLYTIGMEGEIFNTCTKELVKLTSKSSFVKEVTCPCDTCNCTVKWWCRKEKV